MFDSPAVYIYGNVHKMYNRLDVVSLYANDSLSCVYIAMDILYFAKRKTNKKKTNETTVGALALLSNKCMSSKHSHTKKVMTRERETEYTRPTHEH